MAKKLAPPRSELLADVLAASLGVPAYDPEHETTARDLAKKLKRNQPWAVRQLTALQDEGWTVRDVRLPDGHTARAWRPGNGTGPSS